MENHSIKLIDSTYDVNDSKEVLCSLLQNKIQFLNKEIFSIEERHGSDVVHLQLRKAELQGELSVICTMLSSLEEGALLDIECSIGITVKQPTLR